MAGNINQTSPLVSIQQYIDLIPEVNKYNKNNIDVKLIEDSVLKVIEKLDLIKNKKEFLEGFDKLNDRVNYIKKHLNKENYKIFKSCDQKIDELAQKHRIKRIKPGLQRFGGAARKVMKLIHSPDPNLDASGKLSKLSTVTRATKPLSEEYWKEFFDEAHRHPKVLDTVFNEWKVYGHNEKKSFWEYLEEKEASETQGAGLKAEEGVLYLTPEERQQYRVNLVMENGQIVLKDVNGQALPNGVYITVLGPDQQFYAAQKTPGKFQHATFFGGKSVISAGMFVVKNGMIENFVSQSGHYKPEKEEMFKALHYMEKMGVDISKINLIYSTGSEEPTIIENPKEWQEYQDFLAGKSYKKTQQASPNLLADVPEGAKIDRKVAKFLQKNQIDGFYSEDLKAVLPTQPILTQLLWEQRKNQVARTIGVLPNPATLESMLWSNSATTQSELIEQSKKLAPAFKEMCHQIGKQTGTKPYFGEQDRYIVKTPTSLARKVAQDAKVMATSEQDSLAKIGDALRGTIVVDSPTQIPKVVKAIIAQVQQQGGEVVFKNLWAEDRASGYLGVHAKMNLPLPPQEGSSEKGTILVELQIHLKPLMDGTEECVKEYSHGLYERARVGVVNPTDIYTASKLMFLMALQNVKV